MKPILISYYWLERSTYYLLYVIWSLNFLGGINGYKIPRAGDDKKPAAGLKYRSIRDSESETYVACSRRVTGGKRIEALGDVGNGAVDI